MVEQLNWETKNLKDWPNKIWEVVIFLPIYNAVIFWGFFTLIDNNIGPIAFALHWHFTIFPLKLKKSCKKTLMITTVAILLSGILIFLVSFSFNVKSVKLFFYAISSLFYVLPIIYLKCRRRNDGSYVRED
ncbi:MAG: hypothetical protein GPJ54_12345 [Candidatus Heimdallarchaeota archaeon]|nr:hypothetical protein [Candidatus Heimdallarchaeota archaeon]